MGEVGGLTYICTLCSMTWQLFYNTQSQPEGGVSIHTGLVGVLNANAWAEGCFTSVRFLQGTCHLMELLPETSPKEQVWVVVV